LQKNTRVKPKISKLLLLGRSIPYKKLTFVSTKTVVKSALRETCLVAGVGKAYAVHVPIAAFN